LVRALGTRKGCRTAGGAQALGIVARHREESRTRTSVVSCPNIHVVLAFVRSIQSCRRNGSKLGQSWLNR
jgi:hypothetical protein